jgi:hypothetical protein
MKERIKIVIKKLYNNTYFLDGYNSVNNSANGFLMRQSMNPGGNMNNI